MNSSYRRANLPFWHMVHQCSLPRMYFCLGSHSDFLGKEGTCCQAQRESAPSPSCPPYYRWLRDQGPSTPPQPTHSLLLFLHRQPDHHAHRGPSSLCCRLSPYLGTFLPGSLLPAHPLNAGTSLPPGFKAGLQIGLIWSTPLKNVLSCPTFKSQDIAGETQFATSLPTSADEAAPGLLPSAQLSAESPKQGDPSWSFPSGHRSRPHTPALGSDSEASISALPEYSRFVPAQSLP